MIKQTKFNYGKNFELSKKTNFYIRKLKFLTFSVVTTIITIPLNFLYYHGIIKEKFLKLLRIFY